MPNRKATSAFSEKLSIQDNVDGLACLGFEHDGFFIFDPFVSECSRFEVDPATYGLTAEQAAFIKSFNEALEHAAEAAINAGAKVMQDALGVTTGDFAGQYFSGEFECNKIRHALAVYALEEYDNQHRVIAESKSDQKSGG
jgi:hypothetical protein